LAAQWIAGRPGDDDLERLYASELDWGAFPRWRKDLLLSRRVKRNAEDGWAWRELAFRRIADYEHASPKRRKVLFDQVQKILGECERTAPENPATVRANAYWNETVGNWKAAARLWLDSIEREPSNGFGYQRLWLCSAALPNANRAEILAKMREFMQNCTSRIPFVKDIVSLLARRLGSAEAEAFIIHLQEKRPDDPDVIKAAADLLVEMGQARSDASRALQVLEPTVAHFPYHLGLRFSLVNASRKLGLTDKAEGELQEIIRRFPGEESAYLQLAKLLDYVGRGDEITPLMNAAFTRNPDSSEMWATRVRVLARNNKFAEARAVIGQGIQLLPDAVNWRAKAINLLMECGDPRGAVQVAREGVTIYPRGAYLWFLLGNVLNRAKESARPGEVEACFRKSLSLNGRLMDAADLLAVILAEQRRYDEAEAVLTPLLTHYPDPSAVKGRLAWLEWHKGRKPEAIKRMQAILGDAPWYRWGWAVLMEWIMQDKAWNLGRIALRDIPSPFRGDTNFRKQRLGVLEKCSLSDPELESEWQGLLKDFPEDVPLHLQRYDSLRTQRRFDESAKLLRNVESFDPNNPFLRARLAEVLLSEQKYSEAIDLIRAVWFQEIENSPWPVDYSWNAVKNAGVQLRVYQDALNSLRKGLRATPRALHVLASYALGELIPGKARPKPVWSTWYLTKGMREVLSILQHLDPQSGNDGRRITVLLQELVSRGYHRHVISYWKKNHSALYSNVEVWGQVGYCLLSLGHKAEAREQLSEWSQRRGVQMWMVTNYVWSCPRWSRDSREHIRTTCQQALLQLPHDHSAKYLVHLLAESQAILGDQTGFLDTAEKYHLLLDGAVKKSEYFEDRQKYLLTDIPRLVETLKLKGPNNFVRSSKVLRLKQIPFILLSRIKVQ